MSRRSLGIAVTVAVMSAAVLPVSPAQAAGHTLVVNAASPFRPVTHAASGGLYALAENNRPADSTLLPIKLHTLTQPPPGVGQRPNGQPPGGDALKIAPQADRVGAAQVIRMPDVYPDFPYRWVSWNDVPGRVTSYVAKLERASVWAADRAFWYEYGTVNGLVVNNNQPTGSWWLYKWYGEMAGSMVTTTPPAQTGIDGFASYDSTRKRVDVVFGDESGTNSVRVTGLGALGGSVRVTLESTPSSGRFTAVTAPTTIADSTYTVSNGQITVPVPNMSATSAYHLVVQPTSGVPAYQQRYEAENASVFRADRLTSSSASNGGYVGRIDNAGDPRDDSYLDFVVNVPSARTYTMTIGYANGTGATSTHGLAYNGGAWSTVSYPPTAGWGQFGDTVTTTVALRAGYNVIRLAKGAPSFGGGTGFAELDYLHLT